MKPESCSFTQTTQTCHAASWPFSTRRVSTRGLHCSASPALSRLLGQHQPHSTPNHTLAVSTQTVSHKSITSHASVAEAHIQEEAIERQHADKPAKSSSNNRKTHKQSAVQNPASQQSQLESLGLLEWPELCQQVINWLHLRNMCGFQLLICFATTQHATCYVSYCFALHSIAFLVCDLHFFTW